MADSVPECLGVASMLLHAVSQVNLGAPHAGTCVRSPRHSCSLPLRLPLGVSALRSDGVADISHSYTEVAQLGFDFEFVLVSSGGLPASRQPWLPSLAKAYVPWCVALCFCLLSAPSVTCSRGYCADRRGVVQMHILPGSRPHSTTIRTCTTSATCTSCTYQQSFHTRVRTCHPRTSSHQQPHFVPAHPPGLRHLGYSPALSSRQRLACSSPSRHAHY